MSNEAKAQAWWKGLSVEVRDMINRTLFFQKIADVDIAYEKLGKSIK